MTDADLPYAEAAWTRSEPLPEIDDAWVAQRLAAWPDLVGRPWSLLGGGLRSVNLRVGDAVARVAAHESSRATLAKEAALLRTLDPSVPAPAVLATSNDALLLRYTPHRPLTSDPATARAVGTAAAHLHARRYPAAGELDESLAVRDPQPDAWAWLRHWATAHLRGHAGDALGPESARIDALWDREDARLRQACADPRLIHADFKPANIKRTTGRRDARIVVFDWEFAAAGPPLLDLGQMIRWGAPPAFQHALAEGYRDAAGHDSLPDDWARVASLIDLVNLVAFLARAAPGSACARDVHRRIVATLATR